MRNASAYARSHTRRYMSTIRAWEKWGRLRRGLHVLDVGAKGDLMQRFFDWYKLDIVVENLRGDITHPWKQLRRPQYDLVLCLETLEHLKDRPIDGLSQVDAAIAFHYIGLWNFFVEARNVLAPNGVLLSTTPNANGYLSMRNIFLQVAPPLFELHVHELTVHELRLLHVGAGFRVIAAETRDVFAIKTYRKKPLVRKVEALLKELHYDTSLRGDDLLFVATPAGPPQRELAIRTKVRESVVHVACRDGDAKRELRACDREWTLGRAEARFGNAVGDSDAFEHDDDAGGPAGGRASSADAAASLVDVLPSTPADVADVDHPAARALRVEARL